MKQAVERSQARVIGREAELARLHDFLGTDSRRAFVLAGDPGMGKTTLWEAGIEVARERSQRVLVARPSGAETHVSLAGLIDLLDEVDLAELEALAGPQRRALAVALLRADPGAVPPEPHAIRVGFLNALRTLAVDEPVLVAIDDLQWLDPPSADALAFAARRLEGDDVRFLAAKRPVAWTALEQALQGIRLECLEVGPLSLGAIRRLLSDRLELSLPRHVLRRLVESTAGSPLFALEVGRALLEGRLPAAGEELPIPERIEDLLGTRVEQLSPPIRRLLLAVSLRGGLTTAQLAKIEDSAAVDDAIGAGLVLVEGDRVRASHPLLAAAARKRAQPDAQRELHRRLAEVIAEGELHAWHLALAVEGTDPGLATIVAEAAAAASARGAAPEAVELARHALRLTPIGTAEWSDRLLALADCLVAAGELQQLLELLEPVLETLPAGAARARACLLVVEGIGSPDESKPYSERALAESENDPELHAVVLAQILSDRAAMAIEGIAESEEATIEALPAARRAGPEVERDMLFDLSWARTLRGRPIDDVCERFREASETGFLIAGSPERVAGQRHVWRGELELGRAIFTRLAAAADERGESISFALQRLHLCELALRAGDWDAAERLLDEWVEADDVELLLPPMYRRCRALLAMGRGSASEAEVWAGEAIAVSEATGIGWDRLEALRARGVAALLARDPTRAVESLRAVWEHTERAGVEEPGVFPVAPDLVEALVELGELDEARTVTARLRQLAEEQEHPWALVSAKRCAAMVSVASTAGYERAAAELAEAAEAYEELGLRFDRARSLLILGRAERRLRKWGAARRSLEQAVVAFEELGSPGWVAEAQSELSRVSARKPKAEGQLTEAEQRVAELAADGLANKEIAQTLFVAVSTVEGHLAHVYAKLGIRSRAQLARRLERS